MIRDYQIEIDSVTWSFEVLGLLKPWAEGRCVWSWWDSEHWELWVCLVWWHQHSLLSQTELPTRLYWTSEMRHTANKTWKKYPEQNDITLKHVHFYTHRIFLYYNEIILCICWTLVASFFLSCPAHSFIFFI